MPFKSQAERNWMFANHPEMARRWAAETPDMSDLPEHVTQRKESPVAKQKSDPRMDALSELHAMLTQSIGAKLKSKKLSRDPIEADEPEEQLGAKGEADENPLLAAKKKMQFGPGHKK